LFGTQRGTSKWRRWDTCSLCEQDYHGVVSCALGWACWKTYVGRPESDVLRPVAMGLLGNGLHDADHDADALSVFEAQLSMLRRLGESDDAIFPVRCCLLRMYRKLDRNVPFSLQRDVYLGWLKIYGEEHRESLGEACSYAVLLSSLKRFEEARAVLRKAIPVAQRVLGDGDEMTIGMRGNYARSLYRDPNATLDDIREAVTILEEIAPTARRSLDGAHSLLSNILKSLRYARAALRARETPSRSK
jgi:hypothetical protein